MVNKVLDKNYSLNQERDKNMAEAFYYYNKLMPYINKIIRQVINFNTFMDEDDYKNIALYAVWKAIVSYRANRKYRNIKSIESVEDYENYQMIKSNPSMKIETFIFWFLQKYLYKEADTGEIMYDVYDDENGTYERMNCSNFYKNRNKMENKRYEAVKMVSLISDLVPAASADDNNYNFDFIDSSTREKLNNNNSDWEFDN